jgi:ADP-ribosylglycohydrolase
VIEACIAGAQVGEQLGREHARAIAGPSMTQRLHMALEIAGAARDDMGFLRALEARVGNSVLAAESVPAAIAVLCYAQADPLRTIALCATMGNDTDSIATMAGALAGALRGQQALPAALLQEFLQANASEYGLPGLADQLAAVAAVRSGSLR